MPNGKHNMKLEVPIAKVWEFVRDMNNWAPLVPGYLEHQRITERQSTWKFKGDIGIMQKTVALRVDIKEWIEPTTVTFNLTGIYDNIVGKGSFVAKEITANQTEIIGNLDINAGGMKGPMVNTILKSLVPKTTEDLTEAVANRIEKVEVIVK
ncbi:CoxG family protein [Gracilibacillus massiliensis]|uniref:CoxG family protein n=1 Tax=Gracilibacillus massiliensis TaxID=1564956 RepID=UPI00071E0A87|nr:SRPBCC family protein [Gracilibacillus massiliensis]